MKPVKHKPETIAFINWLVDQESRLKERFSTSRGRRYRCYSIDIESDPYGVLPEYLHDFVSEMESEETKSKEFYVPVADSYRGGIGRLITDEWVEYTFKWKYPIEEEKAQ